jgi:large subunit ribosomal protein L17
MLANMAASLFLYSKVKTTSPRAKALKPLVDRLISRAKEGTLHSKREVARVVRDKAALKRLFEEIVPKLQDRSSGFSRVVKAGFRQGDAAEVSIIELMIEKPKEVAEKKEGRFKRFSSRLRRSSKSSTASEKKFGGHRAETAPTTKPAMEEPVVSETPADDAAKPAEGDKTS